MFDDKGLPIQWDKDEPDDWVCWGVVGPRSVIDAAAADLAARFDGVFGSSVRPRIHITPVRQGLAMISYSEDLFSALQGLDRTSKAAEGGVSDGMFECRTLYEWLKSASKSSTIVHIHAYSHGENWWGSTASVWQKGEVIGGPWRGKSFFDVIDHALLFLTDEKRVVPATPTRTTFISESNVLETVAHGRVLEFIVRGSISHERWDSAELTRRVAKELNDEIARSRARAVIVNLLGFDYSFGNEIGELLIAPYMTLARSGGGKIAILATGQTAASLDDLLTAGHLDSMFGRTCPDLASALAQMTEIPAYIQERS